VVGRAGTDELVGVFDAYADEIGPTVTRDWSDISPATKRSEAHSSVRGRPRKP